MVLLKYKDYELRTVETATGDSFPLITGVCIWFKDSFVGIVEPENDVIAKFTTYPDCACNEAMNDLDTFRRVLRVATDIVQSILSLI